MFLFSKKSSSEITSKIEQTVNQETVDWTSVFEICKLVSQNKSGAKEARKLLQKKMMDNNPRIQMTSLEIMNALIENDWRTMQAEVTAKSFGEDLCRLASSKSIDPAVMVKLAESLDGWIVRYQGVSKTEALVKAQEEIVKQATMPRRGIRQSLEQPEVNIREMIEVAKNSAQVLSQTLSFTDPTKEDISKNTLIQEFYAKCKHAQTALKAQLETCQDPDLNADMLNTFYELDHCFKTYESMLEQQMVHRAMVDSQTNHRTTQVESSTSSSSMQPSAFNPFSDDYQVQHSLAKNQE
ncbi:uncharacterized protein RHIMIDRAFT_242048 [Rhizopus microsporus ATCC 52813]|uniref:VHS domain-containing protein n=1 Tax=Rhizopus microsporus ATCC 52813 TaxID=1340429 RepID=A0A2G4SI74_RHIZD|nr:uncharacterized protein RHIMIDRAFT_242048 [Rhizopus microsporus ATCC 52813]PHZ08096.1 hypothetical protein RHIMIDRAFT_242048 [Rhizopus microsporus ATCC 52813]